MASGIEFTRQELYEQVWSKPVTELAKSFNISNVAINKVCRQYDIPRPGLGYWAKLKSGLKVIKRELPPRFPGLSNKISFGKWKWGQVTSVTAELPVEPTFEESLDNLRHRISKTVSKISVKRLNPSNLSTDIHTLLKIDEERRKQAASEFSWRKPLYDTPFEQRRLRILNALFLAAQRLGCRSMMSISKNDFEPVCDATIRVGHQHVSFTLKTYTMNKKRYRDGDTKEPLGLIIDTRGMRLDNRTIWIDAPDDRLESHLQEILIEIIILGEVFYRHLEQSRYEWALERREQKLAEEFQRQQEAAEAERRRQKKLEQDQIDQLLSDAQAIQHADIIRQYINTVMAQLETLDISSQKLEQWSSWALAQADRIDPLKQKSFLRYSIFTDEDENQTPCGV